MEPPLEGLVVVDKPAGMTSHDVVSRVRRIMGTRKVGHAGTLDPLATGVLILGVERATRLLGHLQIADKAYDATIILGISTVTDDIEGDVISVVNAGDVTAQDIAREVAVLTGQILQRPTAVSAIKVDGVRAYARVRAGEQVELPPRPVTVSEFRVDDIRHVGPTVEIDAHIECTTGTYVRALARDMGDALGVGGHIRTLRRTRVGPFEVSAARTLADLEAAPAVISLSDSTRRSFPVISVDEPTARLVSHGVRIPSPDHVGATAVGVFGPDGTVLSVSRSLDGQLVPLVVFQ